LGIVNGLLYFQDLAQLRDYIRDMFVAATESTTSTIRWILFYLIKHPEIQNKIHQEIEKAVGEIKSNSKKTVQSITIGQAIS